MSPSSGEGASLAPSTHVCLLAADPELLDEYPVEWRALRLEDRHRRAGRVTVRVEGVCAGRSLEVLRLAHGFAHLLAARQVAAVRVDGAADRVDQDVGAVERRERVRADIFLLGEAGLERVDRRLGVRVLVRVGGR